MESDVEPEAERKAEQDVQREDTLQIKRHRSEREDDEEVGGRSTSSSTSRFQTLRTAATLPYYPAKNPRTEDVETQRVQIGASKPIPDVEVEAHHRGASELDKGFKSQQQQQHEQVRGCDYDWSFFEDVRDGTTPSNFEAGPSKSHRTDYNHLERGRRSQNVQEPTAAAGTNPKSGGSSRLRVPYFR